ncbi:2,3,4,5-tetrahydropyridine-2,6-dicarboxylate N-succinyltransferase [Mobiluncus mulieris]|uniref:DapH/DapD/GlmU-related protein n=1 Tax=Mobiluncus mulieris TaxID=2052 RepID=UPI00146FCCBB|nr:DapH/DapD/GlmU-related protein [Mobiluncus mulieris]NMW60303.1 2,3,4,5-tetrahydropyridine-2,6-dicarboxylate N-succinyltransferase [Mobiluncus mulieris]
MPDEIIKKAWGVGVTAETYGGKMLDTWFPYVHEGSLNDAQAREYAARLVSLERRDDAREINNRVVIVESDLESDVTNPRDGFLRLHVLSKRLAKPNTVCLEGLSHQLNLVMWTNHGACDPVGFEETRLRLKAKFGVGVSVQSLDRIPPMTSYVSPSDVRITSSPNVRLGAYLAPGTEIGYTGFVNYNAGTLGAAHIEGRLSQGVTVDEGTTLAGGASTAGTMAIGVHQRVSLGRNCHLGANSGLAIPLGDECVIEPGLYLNADTKVYVMPSGGVIPGETGFFMEPKTLLASDLSGVSNALFRRNSQTGRVECVSRDGLEMEFAD